MGQGSLARSAVTCHCRAGITGCVAKMPVRVWSTAAATFLVDVILRIPLKSEKSRLTPLSVCVGEGKFPGLPSLLESRVPGWESVRSLESTRCDEFWVVEQMLLYRYCRGGERFGMNGVERDLSTGSVGVR